MKRRRFLFAFLYIMMIALISCFQSNQNDLDLTRELVVNKMNEHDAPLFYADSLYSLLQIKEAIDRYEKILEVTQRGSIKEAYIISRLASIQLDFPTEESQSIEVISEEAFMQSDLFYYQIKNQYHNINIETILSAYQQSKYLSEKVNYLNQLSIYYDLVLDDLEESESYSNLLAKHMEDVPISTIWHYKYALQAINLNSYQRNNVRAMSLANNFLSSLKDRSKCSTDVLSKIHEQKAFLFLRLSLFEEAKIEIDSIYSFNRENPCAPIIESAERITLYTCLLGSNPKSFESNVYNYKERRNRCGGSKMKLDEMLGFFYLRQNKIDSARYYLEKAEREFNRNDKTTTKIQKTTSYTLSEMYQASGEYEEALNKYCEHLELGITSFDSEYILAQDRKDQYFYIELLRFGSILYDQWKQSGSKEILNLSLKFLSESERKSHAVFSSINEELILPFIQYHEELYNLLLSAYNDLYQLSPQHELLELSWAYNSKQFNLLLQRDLLIHQSNNILSQETIDNKKSLEYDLKQVMNTKLRSLSLLNDYVIKEQILQKRLGGKLSALSVSQSNNFPSEIVRKLDSTTSLLCFTVVNDHIYRYHLSEDSISVKQIKYGKTERKTIDSLYQNLSMPIRNIEVYKKYSQEVFDHLIGHDLLEYSKDHWIVMADPILPAINLAGLTVDDEGDDFCGLNYLSQSKDISYSMTDQLISHASNTNEIDKENNIDKIIGFAYSSEHSNPAKYFPELDGSYHEIQSLKEKYGRSTVRSGCSATKEEFKKLIIHPQDIIHLALHGKTNVAVKDDVMLIFRDEHCDADTLYGYELMNYSFKNTKVILSACDTDKGKTQSGEGNFSLTRYFFIAGANEVISSIWQLNDKSTSILFDHYYRNGENLQLAQKKMLENPDTCHPYYWAGLIEYRLI